MQVKIVLGLLVLCCLCDCPFSKFTRSIFVPTPFGFYQCSFIHGEEIFAVFFSREFWSPKEISILVYSFTGALKDNITFPAPPRNDVLEHYEVVGSLLVMTVDDFFISFDLESHTLVKVQQFPTNSTDIAYMGFLPIPSSNTQATLIMGKIGGAGSTLFTFDAPSFEKSLVVDIKTVNFYLWSSFVSSVPSAKIICGAFEAEKSQILHINDSFYVRPLKMPCYDFVQFVEAQQLAVAVDSHYDYNYTYLHLLQVTPSGLNELSPPLRLMEGEHPTALFSSSNFAFVTTSPGVNIPYSTIHQVDISNGKARIIDQEKQPNLDMWDYSIKNNQPVQVSESAGVLVVPYNGTHLLIAYFDKN